MKNDPIERFHAVFEEAKSSGIALPERACLATASRDGVPSTRMVLLKSADERGFVFYTNMESAKCRDLAENPRASLCFWWETTGEQVRVAGPTRRVSDEEADAYFATRDRESQIGAWASDQSRELDSRETLMKRFEEVKKRYGDGPVERPPHWSGFRIVPERIEFWKNQPHRLHDRELYTRDGDSWKVVRLYP